MRLYCFMFISIFLISIVESSLAQEEEQSVQSTRKVVVKYREKEKFDLDDLNVQGDSATPGDLSVSDDFRNEFRNKLPHRFNFNPEIRNAVEAIR